MGGEELSKKRIAEIYGVSVATLRRWAKVEGFPDLMNPKKVFEWAASRKNRPKTMRSLEEVMTDLGAHIESQLLDPGGEQEPDQYSDPLAQAKLEKTRAERDILAERLKVMKGEVVEKTTAAGWVAEIISLIFQRQEMSDEEMAEDWEGQPAIKILEGRKREREKLRNECANYLEAETE